MKVSTVGALGPTRGTPPTRKDDSAGQTAAGPGEATSTRLSAPAQLLSKLSQLRDSDPEQFSQVVSSLASELREAAKGDSGMAGKMLTGLASKLDDVVNGGDLSQLESLPLEPAPRGTGGAPPAKAPPSAAASYSANAYRSSSHAQPAGEASGRAALSKMLDEIDAALSKVSAKGARAAGAVAAGGVPEDSIAHGVSTIRASAPGDRGREVPR